MKGEIMRHNFKFSIAVVAFAAIVTAESPVQALPVVSVDRATEAAFALAPTQIRAGYRGDVGVARGHRGGAVVRGPRGGVAAVGGSHYHGGYRHGGYYHGGRYYGGGAWVRPYRWAPGGAIAAGAAIGFVTAATAAAWASAPPEPGLCWYYTDPSQRAGFWDTCPR